MIERNNIQPTPFLDLMLETEEAAKWLKMTPRQLLAETKGKRARIPAFWINRRVVRFNPRAIIAKLSTDAGVAPEVIVAMYQIPEGVFSKASTSTNENNNESKN